MKTYRVYVYVLDAEEYAFGAIINASSNAQAASVYRVQYAIADNISVVAIECKDGEEKSRK